MYEINKLILQLIMAAHRAGHYILQLWFLSSSFFVFLRLISAVADWLSTVLLHMMWPWCEFKMQI